MKISIAMATYNGARFLPEQLQSLAEQTLLPYELVVTDDGSTDETLNILDDFASIAPFPVRIYRNKKRLGYADNFLHAASLCRGELISFCDQDDVWLPYALQKVHEASVMHGDILLTVHSADVVDEDLNNLGYRLPDIKNNFTVTRLHNLPWWVPPGFSMTFKADLVQRIPWTRRPHDYHGPRNLLAHDKWIYFLANALGDICYISDVLVLYRQHNHNTCGANEPGLRRELKLTRLSGIDRYHMLSKIAEENSLHLKRLSQICDSHYALCFAEASQYYLKISKMLDRRAALYDVCSPLMKRAQILLQSIFQGSYRSKTNGGLGIKAFAKDMVATAFPNLFGSR